MIYYLAFSNGWLLDAIILTSSVCVNLFIGTTVLYNRPLDSPTVILYILIAVTSFFAEVLMNILVIQVAKMNEQRKLANDSHISLLDGMHEGLLILSQETAKTPPSFMFCNRPA